MPETEPGTHRQRGERWEVRRRRRLPTGAVAFLLTHIEDSARGWEADREQMATAVARHYETGATQLE
jgi:hypothetical protein